MCYCCVVLPLSFPLLCYSFFILPPCSFLALVAQQHQVVFGGTEKIEVKKQHIQCEGSFVILQSLVGLKSTWMFEWDSAEAAIH